jgi:IstB-like ATP binding protein
LRLPRLTNQQFEEVEILLHRSPQGSSHRCPTCGAKPVEVAPGIHEWAESTFEGRDGIEVCDCDGQVNLFRHYLLAHIPEEYMRLDPEDYYGDPKAWDDTSTYLEHWDDNRVYGLGLGYYSKTQGTGKTFLATRVARDLVKRGESVFYINFRDIMSLYESPYEDRARMEDRLKNSTMLVLDEVVQPISSAQHGLFASKFEELVRYRTNYGRVTIITSNLEPSELDDHYERTYSLLAAKQSHIGILGNDARREGIWDYNTELAENGQRRPIT